MWLFNPSSSFKKSSNSTIISLHHENLTNKSFVKTLCEFHKDPFFLLSLFSIAWWVISREIKPLATLYPPPRFLIRKIKISKKMVFIKLLKKFENSISEKSYFTFLFLTALSTIYLARDIISFYRNNLSI